MSLDAETAAEIIQALTEVERSLAAKNKSFRSWSDDPADRAEISGESTGYNVMLHEAIKVIRERIYHE